MFGLTAALGWGTSDFLAALSSRRIGTVLTACLAQLSGVVLLALGGVLVARKAPSLLIAGFAPLAGIGVVSALAALSLYRGLELGPVAVVSPIAAAGSAIPVVLAITVLGESLRPLGYLALAAILGGVVVASARWTQLRWARLAQAGVPYGLVAMVALGVHTYLLALASRRYGWYESVLVSRVVSTLVFLTWIVWLQRPSLRSDLGGKAQAALIGAFDVAAFAAFARGLEVGRITVVTGLASAFPLIPMAGGVLLLGERPERTRIAGALVVVVGLVGLAVFQ